jgi:hypothetical protein
MNFKLIIFWAPKLTGSGSQAHMLATLRVVNCLLAGVPIAKIMSMHIEQAL